MADLWLRTAPPMGEADRLVFRDGVERMTASWVWELQNHMQHRIPDPVDYVEMRRDTFGSDLTMNLARVTQRGNLPRELFRTTPMIELENAAQDYACMLNDIFSYQKEIQFEGELHNSVLVVRELPRSRPAQAVLVVNDLMTSRMRQFEHIIATELPYVADSFELDDEDRSTLDAWVAVAAGLDGRDPGLASHQPALCRERARRPQRGGHGRRRRPTKSAFGRYCTGR